jgi:hypothetical protein
MQKPKPSGALLQGGGHHEASGSTFNSVDRRRSCGHPGPYCLRIIDNNSAGPTAKPDGGGTFSHNAAEVLQAPCPAFIKVVIYLPKVKTLFFAAVCKNNGDELDTNSLFN